MGVPMSHDQGIIGQQLTLYDGSKVLVRAAPLAAAGDLAGEIVGWFEQLAARLAGEAGPASAPLPQQPPVTWAALVLFALSTSDPDRGIDLAWCKRHVFLPDVSAILKAWIEENRLEPVIEGLKNRAAEAAVDLVKALVTASARAAAAPAAPGEAAS